MTKAKKKHRKPQAFTQSNRLSMKILLDIAQLDVKADDCEDRLQEIATRIAYANDKKILTNKESELLLNFCLLVATYRDGTIHDWNYESLIAFISFCRVLKIAVPVIDRGTLEATVLETHLSGKLTDEQYNSLLSLLDKCDF